MKIGITYDIKEQYGFTSLDLNFTDFLNVADVTFAKEELEKCGHEVFLLGNARQMIHNLNQNISVDLVFNLAWGHRGRKQRRAYSCHFGGLWNCTYRNGFFWMLTLPG